MATSQHEHLNCSRDVIGGLIETATIALMANFPKTSVNIDDIESVLDALHILRPETVQLDVLDGMLHAVRGQWPEAIRVLHSLTEKLPQFEYAKALLAYSLSSAGDGSWRRYADEVLSGGGARSVKAFVMAIVARNDMIKAAREVRMGGRFVEPESLAILHAMTQEEGDETTRSAAQGSAIPDALVMQHTGSFMRA
jgi:type III secretion protein HrpB1